MKPQQRISGIFLYSIGLITIIVTTTYGQDVQVVPPYYHNCSNTTIFTKNSPYQNNLNILLSSLTFNNKRTRFFNTSVGQYPDEVYGLYLCRGDVNTDACAGCVNQATQDILSKCPLNKVAILWYDYCLLRYSNKIVSRTLDQTSMVYGLNSVNVTESQARFMELVANTLREVAIKVVESSMKFAVKDVNYSSDSTLYALMECTPDLSSSQCEQCLKNVIGRLLNCCTNRLGARVLTPSCYFRYETYGFYNNATPAPLPSPRRKRSEASKMIIGVSISSVIGLLLILLGCYIYTLRKRKNQTKGGISVTSQESRLLDLRTSRNGDYNYPKRSSDQEEIPILQLDDVHKATRCFSDENKLGEGGFGPVYKGTLENGTEIAVKRLSRNSCQGVPEFMNEVFLIARLQHKNLVKLVGCCFEKNEKLLIYEYMPNKSLDLFLFDPKLAVQLDWQRRFSIINGVARGLTYLHEDSRLKIIHRDLKASNVLLDNGMNPKISDFGMARIFGENQNQANTDRIVGTYGYMAPEYDVFSFGVIVLEIISGKKNNGFHLSEQGESLLTYAWKLWCNGKGMELMESKSRNVGEEVLKFIQIGLLCVQEDPVDRPSMSNVVVMLASDIITLPRPSKPAFSVGRLVSVLSESSNHKIFSVNHLTFSNVAPS